MALIPAGEFLMGSPDGLPDEQPVHEAWLGAFRFYVDQRVIVPRSFIAGAVEQSWGWNAVLIGSLVQSFYT